MEPVRGRIEGMEEISGLSAEERNGRENGGAAGRTTVCREPDPSGPLERLSGLPTSGGR